MSRLLVVVTEPEYRRGESVFASSSILTFVPVAPDEDALAEAIERFGARHAIVGAVPYRGRLYTTLPRGSVLARFGVGHESIDKARATEAGLLCTNTPDVLHQSVAELSMAMIGAAARHVVAADAALRRGEWTPQQGTELQGETLAIVGCGVIGRTVAMIAARGYGMRVIGFHRRAVETAPEHFERVTADFGGAVREADFVSVHIPGSPENAGFISRDRLALFRSDAWLINTARGAVVDEAALFEALSEGRLGGAALDVFEREPYEPVDPSRDLRALSNVILIPHIGSNTAAANRRMAERAIRNILLAENGEFAEMDLLNPRVLG